MARDVPRVTAEQRIDARNENGEIEWLRQVIVGSSLEPPQHIFGAAARGEHENRRQPPSGAHAGGNSEPVDAREHDVEHYEIDARRIGLELPQGGFAVVYQYHFVP